MSKPAWRQWVNLNLLGVLMLIGAFSVSLGRILSIRHQALTSDKKIIRISHWQLELGYRGAMDAVIDRYEQLHPDVQVVQMPVSERVYGQWLNVHLVSGTAPDVAEIGFSKMATDEQYLSRFFLPLTGQIDKPNPYNQNTPIEDLPWRETFYDGMRGSYSESLQDYFSAPTSTFTIRLFYNKDMFREATGSSEPPKTMGELLEACRQIKDYAARQGRENLVPIASSKYNLTPFVNYYRVPFTSHYEKILDVNLDGGIAPWESYQGYLQGKVSMFSPRVQAYHECLLAMCDYFTPGFMGMGRQQASFSFVMGNAAMIASGSWDAMSLFKQAQFEVGVIGFPLPAVNDKWGQYVLGPPNEAGLSGGAKYGVYKFSKNRDQAVDFLKFLTSLKANQLLNRQAEWLPVTLGARPTDRMEPFLPNPKGYNASVNFAWGSHNIIIYQGLLAKYLQGELDDYQVLASGTQQAMESPRGSDYAWGKSYTTERRWCRNQERVLSVQLMRGLFDSSATQAPDKYRRALLQQVRKNGGNELKYRFEQLTGRTLPETR